MRARNHTPLVVLVIAACSADPAAFSPESDGSVPPVETRWGRIEGRLQAPAALAPEDVRLTVWTAPVGQEAGEQVGAAVIGQRGYFSVEDVPAELPLVVRAEAVGHSSTGQRIAVAPGGVARVVLALTATQTASFVPGETGAHLELAEVVIDFHAGGSWTLTDGTAPGGTVRADLVFLDDPEEMALAPGALTARLADGREGPLQSFGMFELRLSSGGQPVRFAGLADVSFPITPTSPLPDGTVVPLWTWDEGEGLWIQEGEGVVEAGRFQATVSHFTWWNADMDLGSTSCLQGLARLPDGTAAAGAVVQAWGLDYLGWSSTLTAPDGSFCVPVLRGGLAAVEVDTIALATHYELQVEAQAPELAGACGDEGACAELGVLVLQDPWVDNDGDGLSELAGDCDDDDADRRPGISDPWGDGFDADCDQVDGVDNDGDGAAGGEIGAPDCDDEDAQVGPGATERCDVEDNDCDGLIDEGSTPDSPRWYPDLDADGWGDPALPTRACDAPLGSVAASGDCDDGDPSVHPTSIERCGGGDEDCDGLRDEAGATGTSVFHPDLDGDGWGAEDGLVTGCLAPTGFVDSGGDCDDETTLVAPGGVELCDGLDNDCEGTSDGPDALATLEFWLDGDGDGWGGPVFVVACAAPSGSSLLGGDCDDADPTSHPGAAEDCALAVDRNCDGAVLAEDGDGDGTAACLDCDDGDGAVHPGAIETCDSSDTDCDGSLVDWFADLDGDLLPDCIDDDDDGDLAPDAGDCAAEDATIAPGAPESCDELDADCDADLVDGEADRDSDGTPDCVDQDDDGDGWADTLDCGPQDNTVFPGAEEACDGVDDDCDGGADPCALDSAVAVVHGDGLGFHLGSAVVMGDLTGDGIADLVVGSPASGFVAPQGGAVHVLAGPLAGTLDLGTAVSALGSDEADANSGSALAVCDLDDDGQDDLVVGAWGASLGGNVSGAVWVFYGPMGPNPTVGSADAEIVGEMAEDWAGWSLACGGDVTGDGVDDLVVGAWRYDGGLVDRGAAYVLAGPIFGARDLSTADAVLLGELSHDHAGAAVAIAPDTNGDGIDDVVVGAWGHDGGGPNGGAAYLVLGPVLGIRSLTTADWKVLPEAAGDRLGGAVAGLGDTDGDGLGDIAVGAWGQDDAGDNAGAVYVFGGGGGGVVLASSGVRITGAAAGDELGSQVAGGGDVDGDGLGDLLVAAPWQEGLEENGGAVSLFLGPVSPEAAPWASWFGTMPFDRAGEALGAAWDLDGDGRKEILVGAPFHDASLGDAGAAYIVAVP